MKYFEVTFTLSPYSTDACDVLAALAGEAGFETFMETENGLTGYVQQALFDESALKEALEDFPFEGVAVSYDVQEAEDKDWNEQWEQEGFEPIVVRGERSEVRGKMEDGRGKMEDGRGVIIHDGRHLPDNISDQDIAIEIDAKLAFGTGTHETTRMVCATLLDLFGNLSPLTIPEQSSPTRSLSHLSPLPGPIGIFDSGYGGLTILHGIRQVLPQYDYLYLGDNARAPYGPRSFDVVYEFTRQAVLKLFEMGCHLVILGCNTASAKALRTIQQNDIPQIDPNRRVLGIIRPTAEVIGNLTKNRHVGVLATEGTIKSESYNLEIQKLHPDIQVSGVACPFWVPLVEYNEADSPGADYFVKKRIDQIMRLDPQIDAIILGCTHYPLLMPKILKYLPTGVRIIPQGEYVAESLKQYLERHPQMEEKCAKNATVHYLTTENPDKFKESAQLFLHESIDVENITLG